MTTKWVVTTATERVALDEATRGGEATFMVTNQSPKSARAMFDIKTGTGVDESWFSVEDPQRPIRPAASVPYLVKIQVPQQVPPGQYEFEARVYPPDSAPEENFVLSRRVMLEVPQPPAPPKKKFPWWIVVAAALLVIVIVVVTIIVWPSGGSPEPAPSASPPPSAAPVEYVPTPPVLRKSIQDARTTLTKAGLDVGLLHYKAGEALNVTRQSIPSGTWVPKGTKVDLELQMPFSPLTITAPGNNTSMPPGRWPTITWTSPDPYIKRWRVWIQADLCTKAKADAQPSCSYPVIDGSPTLVTAPEYAGPMPKLNLTPAVGTPYHSGRIVVSVAPLDDFGTQVNTAGTTVLFYLEH